MDNEAENIFYDAVILKEVKTKDEVISYLSQYLLEKGYVNESYCRATLEREELYPTGLPTKPIGIAVPHSNPENVIKQAIVVAITDQLIEFVEMGSSDSKTNVGIVFLLALKGENRHLNYLKNIVNYFKQENNVAKFYAVNSAELARKIFMTEILNIR